MDFNNVKNFTDFVDELENLIQKYPTIDKISLVIKENTIKQSTMNEIELAYSNSDAQVVNNETEEFESYFRLDVNGLGICTWNSFPVNPSQLDKDEERGIEMLEDQRQSN